MSSSMPDFAAPGLFARRPAWRSVPAEVRLAVEQVLGARMCASRDVSGGMSPGPAAIVELADGRRVFVKAVAASASSESHRFYKQEAVVLAALPRSVPAPRLLGVTEVGDWCALVMTAAEGVPAGPPWTDDGIRLVTAACETLAGIAAPPVLPPIADLLTDLDGWHRLLTEHPGRLDPWEREHAPALARLSAGWPQWTAGRTLVHQDIRADNAVIDPGPEPADIPSTAAAPASAAVPGLAAIVGPRESTAGAGGRVVLVDWSFGCAGADWLDRARLAADIVGSGHHDGPAAALEAARRVLGTLPGGAGRFVAALGGMWRYRSVLPAPPGHPTLRGWQRARAQAVRGLLEVLIEPSHPARPCDAAGRTGFAAR
ncbi:phosphotransferase [Paractinoplanes lichenicola]|uniref:Phosphotransferase n=1 Tax=Paractinoplanes lichenicola TaxID=2802976 RepID=A0ABS1VQZ4_9ACTN|nr:phosphotransferase [Actinoplanes lichenicola]MBL7256911.1 phosphotransferase [Actinoplanes lichenicola]